MALNDLVAIGDERDDHRHVEARRLTVAQHFAAELVHLRSLPDEPFDVALALNCRVDTKSRICVRQSFYSVPVRYAGRRIDVRLGADRVSALDGAAVVALHPRAQGKGSETLELDHYLEVLSIKPGALAGASALVAARRSGAFSPTHQHFWDLARRAKGDGAGTRALIAVLLLHRTMTHGSGHLGHGAGHRRRLDRPRSGRRRGPPLPRTARSDPGDRASRWPPLTVRPRPCRGYDDLLEVG